MSLCSAYYDTIFSVFLDVNEEIRILENVRRDVDQFVKDELQFDDLTMLCLEYKGNSRF